MSSCLNNPELLEGPRQVREGHHGLCAFAEALGPRVLSLGGAGQAEGDW